MASISALRIRREIKEIMRRDETIKGQIKIEVVDDDLTHLIGEITGPRDTPYEGGKFIVDIRVPADYPFIAPKVRFLTQMWHPNISFRSGAICNDLLQDNWAAVMTLPSLLLYLQALLSDPELDDPQDTVVNMQYYQSPDMFHITAKHWTHVYASGPHALPDCDSKVEHLKEMGINEDEARIVLSKKNWNLDYAVNYIFQTE